MAPTSEQLELLGSPASADLEHGGETDAKRQGPEILEAPKIL